MAALCMSIGSCRSSKSNLSENGSAIAVNDKSEINLPVRNPDSPITGMRPFIPKAQVYRTNGNYNDNVPIQVADDGKTLISFPAPTDIDNQTKPLPLADGFLLDRRGISTDSRFTTYTYADYSALQAPPSIENLLKSIIPHAMITELVALPMTTQEALADTAAVNRLIRTGFPDCNIILSAPAME